MGHQDFLLVVLTAVSPAWCPCLTFVHGCCHSYLQFSVMDVSVRTTMKGAAKCDKHCELQNSVNRQGLERILCFWDIPGSMPASVSMLCCSSRTAIVYCCCEILCLRVRSWCSWGTKSTRLNYCCQLTKLLAVPVLAVHVISEPCVCCIAFDVKLLWHEVRSAHPLNLSI